LSVALLKIRDLFPKRFIGILIAGNAGTSRAVVRDFPPKARLADFMNRMRCPDLFTKSAPVTKLD
jgi:hypothetical protein